MWSDTPLYVKATVKLLLLALIVLTAVMAREFLIPFTIAVFFTFLLLPVSRKLMQWKFPRTLAIVTSIVLAAAVFVGLLYFFYTQVANFSDDWPELQQKLGEKWDAIQQYISREFHITRRAQGKWVDKKLAELAESGHVYVLGIITRRAQGKWVDKKLAELAESGRVYVLGIFSATGAFLANLALIPIYIFFLTRSEEHTSELQ